VAGADVTHLLDSDTAMRVGLRRQLADLAECRDQAVGRVVALDRMIADVRLRLEQAEAKR
jgi:hypothetical protein